MVKGKVDEKADAPATRVRHGVLTLAAYTRRCTARPSLRMAFSSASVIALFLLFTASGNLWTPSKLL